MSNGNDAPKALLPQELELIIGGVGTTADARQAAKALLLQGLVTDARKILAAMEGDDEALTQSVRNLAKVRAFLEVSPLTGLAGKFDRLEARLRAALEPIAAGSPGAASRPGIGSTAGGTPPGTSDGESPGPSVNPTIPAYPPVDILDSPDPVPDGPSTAFINARRTAPKSVVFIDAAGREVVREGGSRAWRNNNPGNIRRGNFSEAHGAIGDDGAFAIFPDEETGFRAIVSLLRSPSYSACSIEAAIARYAPPAENDTHSYVDFVVEQTGLGADQIMGELRAEKIRAIARAIKRKEGWIEGAERPLASAGESPAERRAASSAAGAAHEWMTIAEREAALPAHERSEWPDPGENPRILEYIRTSAAWFDAADGDETDWCASFVNFCLTMSGHDGTNHPGARSFFWNKNGRFVRLASPQPGCIAVRRHGPFDDEAWRSGPGHVGFVTSSTETSVTLLGGNQDRTVCRKKYSLETRDEAGAITSKFVAFLMPVMN